MISLLCGDNEFEILREKRRIIEEFLANSDALGLERIDGDDIEPARLRDMLLQLPFLSPKKLVVISPVFESKPVVDVLAALVGVIPEEVDVLLVDAHADKRTRLYKQLAAVKSVRDFTSKKGADLERWAAEYALSLGAKITPSDIGYLINRVGPGQMQLARELEKLAYVAEITRKDIDELTDASPRGTVFELLEATFSGRQADAKKLLANLYAQAVDPSEVLGLMAWQLHAMALVKSGQGKPHDEIAKTAKMHPFVVSKTANLVRNWSMSDIKQFVKKALDTDVAVKTGQVDAAPALELLLLELK